MHALRTVAAGLLLAAIAASSAVVPVAHAVLHDVQHAQEDRGLEHDRPADADSAFRAQTCTVCVGLARLASEPPAGDAPALEPVGVGLRAPAGPAPVQTAPPPARRLGRAPPSA